MTQAAVLELADWLRTVAGQLNPGDRMPSDAMLGISRPGARPAMIARAYAALVDEGLLCADGSGGHVVADPPGRVLTPAAAALLVTAAAALMRALAGEGGPLPVRARRAAQAALEPLTDLAALGRVPR